jgi:hypothetical protein
MNAVLEPGRPSKQLVEDVEDLGDLPPLDGAEDEAEAPVEDLDDVPPEPSEGSDPFDDATGEGDPVDELAPEGKETGWLDDAADADELDVGPHDLDEEERDGLLDDADEPGVADEDFGLHDAESSLSGDAGEEGPDAEDEELREEDLPRLDADDEGEGDEVEFTDAWPGSDDERPPWDDRAWERAPEVPKLGLARSVVLVDGAVLVAGAVLTRVDTRGALAIDEPLIHGKPILAAARLASAVAILTERGLVVRGDDGTSRDADGWRAVTDGAGVDVAASGQGVWVRTRSGALVGSSDGGRTWDILAASGIAALTAGPSGLVVLAEAPGGALVAARGALLERSLEALPPLPAGCSAIVRTRGDVVVAGGLGAGAFRSIRGGPWERLEGTSNVTALAILDDEGTVLAALHVAAEDRTWVVRVGADKVARIVAELGGDADEGEEPRVLDLAWDDAAKVAWVVGPFGLAVLRPR